MNIRIFGHLPEGLGIHLMHHGTRMDLSSDTPVEVDVAEGETITLTQDPPLTRRWQTLAALGVAISAPIQAALGFGDNRWNDVIPYRLEAVLCPSKDATCTVQVTKSPQKLYPPRLEISGDGVALVQSTCEAAPQVLHQAYFIFLSRVVGMLLWGLALLGALFYGAMTQNNTMAAAICAMVALALVLVCSYISIYNRKVLRLDLEILQQISHIS